MNEDNDSDDDLDRNWEVTCSPTKEHLLPLLECPICFTIATPPIRTCTVGHILCSDCAQKLVNCPLCLEPLGIGRSFFAEAFFDSCVIKCKYAPDGCDLEIKGEKLKDHLALCDYRPIRCTRCGIKVPFPNFENHLLRAHSIGPWDLDDGGIRVLLSAKRQTARFKVEILDVLSHRVLYKTLLTMLAVSIIVDFLLTSC